MAGNPLHLSLEPAAQALCESADKPPYLYQLPPTEGRKRFDQLQASAIFKPPVNERWIAVDTGAHGPLSVRIVKPPGATGLLPVILYIHGAGWVFGNAHTHDRLVRDLAIGAQAAVVFPEYALSPEAKYPTAIEQNYAVAQWVSQSGQGEGLDASRMAICGDSVGGNMAIALTLMAKARGDVRFVQQVLFYPVTDAAFDTESYRRFANGYYLTLAAMQWFWDQYTTDPDERAQITASPLRATTEQLAGLPPALVINGEADVLRDEGEAYAAKLREAGVAVTAVRYGGVVHDFVMLNALHDTHAAKAAVAQAAAVLKSALHGTV